MLLKFVLIALAVATLASLARADDNPNRSESYIGRIAPVLQQLQRDQGFPMDFKHRGSMPVDEWRRHGREQVERALSYSPRSVPLDIRYVSSVQRKGYKRHLISFAGTEAYRVPAFLLVPEGQGPFPAIVALHDHGGYYYFGKEKIVDIDNPHVSLVDFKRTYYGGRSYADDLAQRGFVVIITDAFYWGDRKLTYENPPKDYIRALAGLDPGTKEYINAFNDFMEARCVDLNTDLAFAGLSWLGIVNYDDRRSIDVLESLPQVDKTRIGCVGLSGGGFRSTYLAGMDPRIKAAVIVGWMSTLPSILSIEHSTHGGLYDAIGAHRYLDHPDVATLAAPECAILVEDCLRDRLFTRKGMEDADEKIRSTYSQLKHPERYQARYYDVPHSFTVPMQEDAFAWLEKWLKRAGEHR